MAEQTVANGTEKVIPVKVTQEAKEVVCRAQVIYGDIRCALGKMEEFLALAEEYGLEQILRSLGHEMEGAAEDLEEAERLLTLKSTTPPIPNTPPQEITDNDTMGMVQRVLTAGGYHADQLKSMVELQHHFSQLAPEQTGGGAQ
ncbi:hypothetical protein [Pseudodesulfovibrio indicus]|uniref:Uncharacterized protein n=1 Tax=Pseudodesulfovibrio indicus TaxID=1716143 RepID=A0A126QQZ5_9BACT|nr:hypothetical protein [Pseudodesulfovibrio indicus]AMK12470.1 hypothetical protein AWY79_15860 [Pseudodesulfovibrio indicus]TDT90774.1 hypothetical protein EDC59_102204 [Pseudodesulfovibrio indicus]